MKDSDYTLSELLSNDSFLRWIKNNVSGPEEKKWQRWLEEKGERENIVTRAKYFKNMPFREFEQDGMVFEELRKLRRKLRED